MRSTRKTVLPRIAAAAGIAPVVALLLAATPAPARAAPGGADPGATGAGTTTVAGNTTGTTTGAATGAGTGAATGGGTAVAPAPSAATPAPVPPDKLTILFATSSDAIDGAGIGVLDHAARLYRAGKPIVMIVTGATDATGSPAGNLALSERRAQQVIDGLTDRGIPVARLQLLAAGATEVATGTAPGTADAADRRVDITWR